MRIKILGPVTPARLTEALESAAVEFTSRLGDEFEGFFGANLYLLAFSTSGQQVEIEVDGKEKMITLSLPAGEALRPAQSDEVKVKQTTTGKAAEEKQTQRASEREARRKHWDTEREQMLAKLKAGNDEQSRRAQQFTNLVSLHHTDFIARCNEAIREAWQEYLPVWPNGQKKGEPRPMPYLELIHNSVYLMSGPNIGRRKIRTPLSEGTNYGGDLRPYWKHSAWVDGAVPKLQALIESYDVANTKI